MNNSSTFRRDETLSQNQRYNFEWEHTWKRYLAIYNQSVNGIFKLLQWDQNPLITPEDITVSCHQRIKFKFGYQIINYVRTSLGDCVVFVFLFSPWIVPFGVWCFWDFSLFHWCSTEFDEPSHVQSCLLHGNTLRGSPGQRDYLDHLCPEKRALPITFASRILGPLHSQSELRTEISKEGCSTWIETHHLKL